MQLHDVTATLDTVTIHVPGSTRVTDSFGLSGRGLAITELNDLLWAQGWSVAGPWRPIDGGAGQMRLTTVALKRG